MRASAARRWCACRRSTSCTASRTRASELPDYLPLFCEFLSLIPEKAARAILSDAAPVIEVAARALWPSAVRLTPASAAALVSLASKDGRSRAARANHAKARCADDDSFEALDRAWEEEPVTFGRGRCREVAAVRMPRLHHAAERKSEDRPCSIFCITSLFGIFPYVALTVFAVGSLIRFDREQYSWRSGSSQLLRKRQLIDRQRAVPRRHPAALRGALRRLADAAHGLRGVWASALPSKQMLAITAGAIFGMTCFVGLTILLAPPPVRPAHSRHQRADGHFHSVPAVGAADARASSRFPSRSSTPDGSVMLVLVGMGAAHRHLPQRRVGTRRRRRRLLQGSTSSWA